MKITEWSFGRVTIEGVAYNKDLIVFPNRVKENWWRNEGHSLALEDLEEVFEYKPSVFVMGCGHTGVLKVPKTTREYFKQAGIQLIELKTPGACQELNRLFQEGVDAVGGLHLTC